MPRNRKYFPNKSVVLVSTRTETGLPFPPSYHINFLLWGILAKAQSLYSVKVCHFVFMSNHLHMMIVVDNPEDVCKFVGYIKAESAHAINRILGRRQRTIWSDGYDSPVILTAEGAIQFIEYIYVNPTKDYLEESIKQYPGLSSWDMFITGELIKMCKKIRRSSITIKNPKLSINMQKKILKEYQDLDGENCFFKLEPNAWMEQFDEYKDEDPLLINAQLIEKITDKEIEFKKERLKEGRLVLGATRLRRQSILHPHVPKKYQHRSICLCFDQGLRKAFIAHFRRLDYEAKSTYRSWQKGDTSKKMPPGIFAPRMPVIASEYLL